MWVAQSAAESGRLLCVSVEKLSIMVMGDSWKEAHEPPHLAMRSLLGGVKEGIWGWAETWHGARDQVR